MLIAMIGCMLLGMALPTVAAYLVGVILFVPCLRALGISALCANMFVFYYGIMLRSRLPSAWHPTPQPVSQMRTR